MKPFTSSQAAKVMVGPSSGMDSRTCSCLQATNCCELSTALCARQTSPVAFFPILCQRSQAMRLLPGCRYAFIDL